MKKLLKKLGIIHKKTLKFDVSPGEFFEILEKNVVTKPHKEAIFQKSTHTYRGKLKKNEFRLKEVNKVFDNTRNEARIRGKVMETEQGIDVKIETLGLAGRNVMFLVSGIFFLIILPYSLDTDMGAYLYYFIAYFIPIFLIVGAIVWSRNAAKKMITQFERESFFMVEKNRRRS